MKIGFCGTMSVGKSTLVKELSKLKQFKDYIIETEKSKEIRDKGIKLNTDSTLLGQIIFASYRCNELFNNNLLTDRTILDVCAFTNLAQSIDSIDKEAFESYFSRFISDYDYIFYISPEGIAIEDNGVREINPEYRTAIDNEIKRLISKYKYKIKNYNELSGSTKDRIKQLLEVISF